MDILEVVTMESLERSVASRRTMSSSSSTTSSLASSSLTKAQENLKEEIKSSAAPSALPTTSATPITDLENIPSLKVERIEKEEEETVEECDETTPFASQISSVVERQQARAELTETAAAAAAVAAKTASSDNNIFLPYSSHHQYQQHHSTVVYCLAATGGDPTATIDNHSINRSLNQSSSVSLVVPAAAARNQDSDYGQHRNSAASPVLISLPDSECKTSTVTMAAVSPATTQTVITPTSTVILHQQSGIPGDGLPPNQLVNLPNTSASSLIHARLPQEIDPRHAMTVITIDPSSGGSLYSKPAPVVLGFSSSADSVTSTVLPTQLRGSSPSSTTNASGLRTVEVCGACGGVMPPGGIGLLGGPVPNNAVLVGGGAHHQNIVIANPTNGNIINAGQLVCASLKSEDENTHGDNQLSRSSTNSSLQTSSGATGNGDICRICHCEAEYPDAPLIAPCYCTGSLRWVHQSCLQQWIKSSETKKCELCKFEFIMETKIKPFPKWEKLQMTTVERRKIMCSVTFHAIAITCVIWSLYVLIDRTTDEVKKGNLEWPFWTKLIVVAIGFIGGLVFMYVQFKMYIALCRRWRAYNRVIYVQNIPDAVLTSSKEKLKAAAARTTSKETESKEDIPIMAAADGVDQNVSRRQQQQQIQQRPAQQPQQQGQQREQLQNQDSMQPIEVPSLENDSATRVETVHFSPSILLDDSD